MDSSPQGSSGASSAVPPPHITTTAPRGQPVPTMPQPTTSSAKPPRIAIKPVDDQVSLYRDIVADQEDSWPIHPIPLLRKPFAESLAEAMDPNLCIRSTLDAATRRLQLLELDDFSEAYSSRWRQKPGAKFHPLWKLIAQISFGVHLLQQRAARSDEEVINILQTHVNEVDGFLEDTNADFDLAIRDIDERTKLLLLPLDHGRTFGRMLRHRDFRTSILDGNDIIERIIARTTVAMNSSVEDVKKGIEATAELAKFLDRIGNELGNSGHEQDMQGLPGVYTAMRGNAEGWYCCFRGVQEKGEKLADLMARLEALVSEVNRRAGIASRRVLRESRLASGDNLKYENIRTPTTPSRRHTRALSLDKPLPPDPLRAPLATHMHDKPRSPSKSFESSHEDSAEDHQWQPEEHQNQAEGWHGEPIILAPPQKPHDALPPLEALQEEFEADSERDIDESKVGGAVNDPFDSKEFDTLLPSYPLDFKVNTNGTCTPQEEDSMLPPPEPYYGRHENQEEEMLLPSSDGLMPLESMPVELDEHDIMQAQEKDEAIRTVETERTRANHDIEAHTSTAPDLLISRTEDSADDDQPLPMSATLVTAQDFVSAACQDAFEERSLSNLSFSDRASRPHSLETPIMEQQKECSENSPPSLTKSGATNSITSVSADSVDFAQIAQHIELPPSEAESLEAEEVRQNPQILVNEQRHALRVSSSQPNLSPSRQPLHRRVSSDGPRNADGEQIDSMPLATAVLALRSSSFAASQRDSKESIISSYARDHKSKSAPLSRSSSKFTSRGLARTMSIKAIGPTTDESQVHTTQLPNHLQLQVPTMPVAYELGGTQVLGITEPPKSAAPQRMSRSPVAYRLMPDVRPIPSPEPEMSARTALPLPIPMSPHLTQKKSQGFRKSGMNSIRGLLFKRSMQRQNASAGSLGGHVPINY